MRISSSNPAPASVAPESSDVASNSTNAEQNSIQLNDSGFRNHFQRQPGAAQQGSTNSVQEPVSSDSRNNPGPETVITEDGVDYTQSPNESVKIRANDVTLNLTPEQNEVWPNNAGSAIGDDNTINGTDVTNYITMTGNENTANGNGGVDYITVGGGDDNTAKGGEGDDHLITATGNFNTLEGGIGNDTLISVSGANILEGGEGDDIIRAYDSNAVPQDDGNLVAGFADGGLGDDTIEVTRVDGFFVTGDQGSYKEGNPPDPDTHGDDTIIVNDSNSIFISAQGGDDTIKVDALSTDVRIDGGAGKDVVKVDRPLDLDSYTIKPVSGGRDWISHSGKNEDILSFNNIERIEYNNGYALVWQAHGDWTVEPI